MTRITYQNWIVELGRDPDGGPSGWFAGPESPLSKEIRDRVGAALERLPESDREFISRFYFMGQSYRQLSEATGRPVFRLESIHKRAIRRLKRLLGTFVHERFGLETEYMRICPICRSVERDRIDRLIAAKQPKATWRSVIRRLRTDFGIDLSTPQILIGHARYHALGNEEINASPEESCYV